jgi:hypothetical protein
VNADVAAVDDVLIACDIIVAGTLTAIEDIAPEPFHSHS